MGDKYKVIEWQGGGEPIVTIAMAKADWLELLRKAQRYDELVNTNNGA